MRKQSITSAQNQRIRDALRLRDRRRRAERDALLIDGVREINCAADCGVEIHEAFVSEAHASRSEIQQLVRRLAGSGAQIYEVAPKAFKRLAYGDRDDGIVAVAAMPHQSLAAIELPPPALVVVVEAIEKPGNLGAVLRSADGAGADAVIVADGTTDLYNPNVVRASLGTLFSLVVCQTSTVEAIAWLRDRELSVVAARPDGAHMYHEVDFRGPTAIVLGSESLGLSNAWMGADIQSVALPMLGRADSLNVSVATAIVLYEAVRQRTMQREE